MSERVMRCTGDCRVILKLVPDAGDKIPPQMKDIIYCLDDNGGELTISDLLEKLGEVLDTKQPARKVWKFYKTRLIKDGWIVTEY